MRPVIESLSRAATTYVSCHPNAGLPNALGGYDEQPHGDERAPAASSRREGFVNVVGGCCGTTPEHTRRDRRGRHGACRRGRFRAAAAPPALERPGAVRDRPGHGLRADRRADKRDRLGALPPPRRGRRLLGPAVEVALEQVRGGANLLDVNMDADLLDAVEAMTTFLQPGRVGAGGGADPDRRRQLARSRCSRPGLECVQGKGIVNSISLKEGEESFLGPGAPAARARRGRRS